jgi:hypothetical protein
VVTPKVTEISRLTAHRRQVELVRASVLSGVVHRQERVQRDPGVKR